MRHRKAAELRYRLDIQWSPEDRCYVVNVPELPGCMTHGQTIEQAVRRAREAIGGYLESLRARGLAAPAPLAEQRFSGRIPLRLDPILHRNLAVKARLRGMSLNRYIEATLRRRS